jgi:tRNA(fMet)-specific endonuclease VapC
MYLLDTNICIYLIKNMYPHLFKRVQQEKPENIAISAITLAELEFGIAKSQYPETNREAFYEFLSPFEIIPFDETDCEVFGYIRTYLNKLGTPIGPYELQIAAQCLARKITLITNNEKEFRRLPNLSVENWILKS